MPLFLSLLRHCLLGQCQTTPPAGFPREEAHFCSSFQNSCREVFKNVQRSFQIVDLTIVEQLRGAAMRPVLIESAASGLLEAAAAADRGSRRSLAFKTPEVSDEARLSPPGIKKGLSEEDLHLLLGPPAEVQRAGLKHLQQMLSEGEPLFLTKFPCKGQSLCNQGCHGG